MRFLFLTQQQINPVNNNFRGVKELGKDFSKTIKFQVFRSLSEFLANF